MNNKPHTIKRRKRLEPERPLRSALDMLIEIYPDYAEGKLKQIRHAAKQQKRDKPLDLVVDS